jgi:hypothetical protein
LRNFSDDGWVRAEDALPMFSEVRSFVCGDGLPRISASYWFCAAERRVRGEITFGIGALRIHHDRWGNALLHKQRTLSGYGILNE